MARKARVVIPGAAHHVTQRGNNGQDVFFTDDDRRVYLSFLRDCSERFGLKVLAYCLMSNHVYIVGVPKREESLAKALGRTHFAYTQYVNQLYGRSGHLWQNRFHSCPLDKLHKLAAARYVERNPVRARLVRVPWRYAWSSASAHIGKKDKSGLPGLAQWAKVSPPAQWKAELRRADAEEELRELRVHTQTGRPLGGNAFLTKLEKRLGQRLRALPVGRPRKK